MAIAVKEQTHSLRTMVIALAALVVLVYIVTIVKLGPGAVQRPH